MLAVLRMGVVLAAVVAGAASTAPSRAQQPSPPPTDLIDTLNAICIVAQGDRDRARMLATEAGYAPVPDTMVPFLRNTSERTGFMRSSETDIVFVMMGRMNRRVAGKDIVMEFCGVSARPTDHRALDRRLREVMGFTPVRGAGFEAYAWLQTPEGRAPTRSLSDAAFVSMAQSGQMRMVGLDRAGPGSTLIYFLPRVD